VITVCGTCNIISHNRHYSYANNNDNNINNSGIGLIDIIRLHDKQVKVLQTYFLNKQVTSSLHAAAVKADDRCTPLDLVRANANEIATDEEYNNKVKRQ